MQSGSFFDSCGTPLLLFCPLDAVVSFLESRHIFDRARRADAPFLLECARRTAPDDAVELFIFLAHALIISRATAAHTAVFLFSDEPCPSRLVHCCQPLKEFFKSVHTTPPLHSGVST